MEVKKTGGSEVRRIGLVGPIFHRPESYQRSIQPTTETMLAEDLVASGASLDPISPRSFRGGWRILRGRYDVVHFHHPSRMVFLACMFPKRGIYIYTPHRTNEPDSFILRLGHKMMLKRSADVVVSLSPLERDYIRRRYGVPLSRIEVIPNGFDFSLFPAQRRSRPKHSEPWIVTFVGQLIEQKQPDVLAAAIQELAKSNKIELHIASHNPEMLDELRAIVERDDAPVTMVFHGRLDSRKLAALYLQSHVLVLPSRDLEALPSVITEAMATGLPVIAGDVGGIRWQLGGQGQCIPDTTVEKLTNALKNIFLNYDDHAAAAESHSVSVRQRFARRQMRERHSSLYNGSSLRSRRAVR